MRLVFAWLHSPRAKIEAKLSPLEHEQCPLESLGHLLPGYSEKGGGNEHGPPTEDSAQGHLPEAFTSSLAEESNARRRKWTAMSDPNGRVNQMNACDPEGGNTCATLKTAQKKPSANSPIRSRGVGRATNACSTVGGLTKGSMGFSCTTRPLRQPSFARLLTRVIRCGRAHVNTVAFLRGNEERPHISVRVSHPEVHP